jgi:putative tryptophan/tyrosine transport system substrate-binding protein
MRRREVITLLGAAAVRPLVARAQPAKLPTIGFLGSGTPVSHHQWVAAFVERLRELGWIEGSTIAIEYRWAQGSHERAAEIAAEFVLLKVDIIATSATLPTLAAKRATSSIPIVFAAASDPVGSGIVANLGRPGGNVTGLSLQYTDLTGKRLEILREVIPSLRRLAILASANNPGAALEMAEVKALARAPGLEVIAFHVERPTDIASAFEAFKDRVDALYVVLDPLVIINRVQIVSLALDGRVPTMHGNRELVEAGGLMSYGPSFTDLFRRAADYVHIILRGAKPGEMPVEQPTKFELVINLKTAKSLGLTVPPVLLARADEVIE